MDFEFFRREVEMCDRVEDEVIGFSFYGRNGSGMAHLLWERLGTDFCNSQPFIVAFVPSSITEGPESYYPSTKS